MNALIKFIPDLIRYLGFTFWRVELNAGSSPACSLNSTLSIRRPEVFSEKPYVLSGACKSFFTRKPAVFHADFSLTNFPIVRNTPRNDSFVPALYDMISAFLGRRTLSVPSTLIPSCSSNDSRSLFISLHAMVMMSFLLVLTEQISNILMAGQTRHSFKLSELMSGSMNNL